MKTKVRVGRQVEDFLKALAPEPRRVLRQALKGLAENKGDVKQLEGNLSGFSRLRVGRMRVVFEMKTIGNERVAFCFYAGHRATIYAVLGQLLASGLMEEMKN